MKRVGLTLVLTVLLLTALGATIWRFLERAPVTAVGLPNGTIIRLLGTAAGGAPFSTEKPWEKIARRVLPRSWQNWIPQAINTTVGGNTNSLTVYWEVIDPTGAPLNSPPWSDYQAVDDNGFRFSRGGGYSSFGGASGRRVFASELRAFPRRQSTFQFRFLDQKGNGIAMLRLLNPVKRPFPIWTPEALPITRTNDPVVLTLTGLSEAGDELHRYIRPAWTLTSVDPLWSDARPASVMFADATGNEDYAGLSPTEPAWKLRTWVHRRRREDFTEDERLVLTNLAAPGPGEFRALDVSVERAGVKLHVRELAGAGSLYVTNGTTRGMLPPTGSDSGWSRSSDGKTTVEHWGSDTSFFLVDVDGAEPNDEIRFRLLEEQGTEVKINQNGYQSSSKSQRTYQPKFTPPDDAKSLTLEIIVSRPREFEFMINPAEIKRAQPATK